MQMEGVSPGDIEFRHKELERDVSQLYGWLSRLEERTGGQDVPAMELQKVIS